MGFADHGAAAVAPLKSIVAVRYLGKDVLANWQATNDGYQGYVPVTASYTGEGHIQSINPPKVYPKGSFARDTDLARLNGSNDPEVPLGRSNGFNLSLLVGFQRSDKDTKADVDWARSVMKDGMPFPPGRTDNIGNVLDCYNQWKFSSTIAGLVGEEFRGIAEGFEIGAPASLGGDIWAMIRKAQNTGVGRTPAYASGMNALFRAIGKTLGLPSSVRKGLTAVGDRATPALGFVGAAVAGYNASIFGQCLFGYLK